MEDNVSRIKEKVDIVDLIGSYLKLQKAGLNYKARCPFHNEKSGSFFVSPERQIWHCFGCGLGGDIFGFVKQIEGVEFPEALRILAARAGIELQRFSAGTAPQLASKKTVLYEISDLAAKFFGKQLHESSEGKKALAYLKDRGLNDESIEKFRLGFAPESWDGLGNFLARKYQIPDIADAGLLVKKDGGGHYDRFRSRIMFPISDLNGQIVGFTGRIFGDHKDESQGKYVNTPQTAIYDKSNVLYGLNFARMDVRRADRCLVVEGNMDVIMSHQAGATNAVASSGTALTEGHLKIIRRYTENLDLCFDADDAGETATQRGVDLALARGMNVKILTIDEPEVKDAADFVKKHGETWVAYTEKAQPFMEYFYGHFRKSVDLASATGKKLFSQKFFPFVAAISNTIEQRHWIQEAAVALKVNEEIVAREIASIKPRVPSETPDSPVANIQSPAAEELHLYEESLLGLLLKKPALVSQLTAEYLEFVSPAFKDILPKVKNFKAKAQAASADPSEVRPMLLDIAYLKSQEFWKDFDDEAIDGEFTKLLNHLKRRTIVARLESLEYDIKQAERDGDASRLATLVGQFTQLSSQL